MNTVFTFVFTDQISSSSHCGLKRMTEATSSSTKQAACDDAMRDMFLTTVQSYSYAEKQ